MSTFFYCGSGGSFYVLPNKLDNVNIDVINFKEIFMRINESAENYLEQILMLSEKGDVHSVMIAKALGVTKASVSHAMKLLRENGYITVDADNHINLTQSGKKIAESIVTRHRIITRYLMQLGVSEQTAKEDACKIEHDISEETFSAICKALER